jgi:hypothetical protein
MGLGKRRETDAAEKRLIQLCILSITYTFQMYIGGLPLASASLAELPNSVL